MADNPDDGKKPVRKTSDEASTDGPESFYLEADSRVARQYDIMGKISPLNEEELARLSTIELPEEEYQVLPDFVEYLRSSEDRVQLSPSQRTVIEAGHQEVERVCIVFRPGSAVVIALYIEVLSRNLALRTRSGRRYRQGSRAARILSIRNGQVQVAAADRERTNGDLTVRPFFAIDEYRSAVVVERRHVDDCQELIVAAVDRRTVLLAKHCQFLSADTALIGAGRRHRHIDEG